MSACPACSTPLPGDAVFCSRCGTPVSMTDDVTMTRVGEARDEARTGLPRTALPLAGGSRPSLLAAAGAPAGSGGSLIPGQMVTERYRIVARLGAGAMGEVYRADDLHLGQAVALKFLPPALAADPRRVAAFRNEVKVAREVTHPNVCRVHDIGEAFGQLFLSMEYIDGEDLSSLLRRIGRVPHDKAVELGRQVCAGLAAAHERGVLHRDLKPSNIMIDGRGRARLMDFGLAALSGSVEGADVRSGTPVYMAPEQLAGREVTAKSDIYSLGLVLYELFTGRAVFKGAPLREMIAQRESSQITSPSSLVVDLDPLVEEVILRCLDPDPAGRPASTLAVSAALPGGDPLAAALAAGETPSPEMVAAAGGTEAIAPRKAWSWLALALGCLALILALAPRVSLLGVVPLPKPPVVLAERAREVLALVGHDLEAADTAEGFRLDRAYLSALAARNGGRPDWSPVRSGRTSPVLFWYRQHTAPLEPLNAPGMVFEQDPPPAAHGMALVGLSPGGALRLLEVPPPQLEPEGAVPAGKVTDWAPLFRAAGLEMAQFTPAPPAWTPPFHTDERVAWTGPAPAGFEGVTRVEAAAYRGKPSYFLVVDPGMSPRRGQSSSEGTTGAAYFAAALTSVVLLGALVAAAVMARRNLRTGRGDRRGAFRLALALFLVGFASNLIAIHPPGDISMALNRVFLNAGLALLVSGLVWILYLALEPLIRRGRPEALVGWSRVLAGRIRDPRVGRDVLAGAGLGTAMAALVSVMYVAMNLAGGRRMEPQAESLAGLVGGRFLLSTIVDGTLNAIFAALLMSFFMALAFRHRERGPRSVRIGIGIFFTILFTLMWLGTNPPNPLVAAPFIVGVAAIYTLVFARYGLVAGATALVYVQWSIPLVINPSSWTAPPTLLVAALLAAFPLAGFWLVMRGRPQGA